MHNLLAFPKYNKTVPILPPGV